MKKAFYLTILLVLFLISVPVFAVIEESEMPVFAVTDSGKGLQASLNLKVKEGNGKIWSRVSSLVGTSTQSTEKISLEVAKRYANNVNEYDYFFDITSSAAVVDGPSAGAAMTLLVVSSLQDKKLPGGVALTGTINPDGTIGQVGGIFEKTETAADKGIKLFLIPSGEAKQTRRIDGKIQSINLIDHAFKNWGLKVVEVESIDDVLKVAFQEIESIDITDTSKQLPEFTPKELVLPESLNEMKLINSKYLENTRNSIKEAKDALSVSSIEDLSLVSELFTIVNRSETDLEQAELVFEQNYFYSSANLSFIAMVYSNFVKDLAEDPSLGYADSVSFKKKLEELENEINEMKELLSRQIFVEKIEWLVSARERLAWAEYNVSLIKSNQSLQTDSEEGSNFDNLLDYEFAKAWVLTAGNFYDVARTSKTVLVNKTILEQEAVDLIEEASPVIKTIDRISFPDIYKRFDSSLIEKDLGWNEASIVDSSSAKALIEAGKKYDSDTDLNKLLLELKTEIGLMEKALSESKYSLIWPRLYFDHAKFFYESANYYIENGNNSRALGETKDGLKLIALSKAVFNSMDLIIATANSFESTENLTTERPLKVTSEGSSVSINFPGVSAVKDNFIVVALLFLAVFIILVGFYYFFSRRKGRMINYSSHKHEHDIKKIHSMIDEVNSAFAKGLIDKESHEKMFNQYTQRLEEAKNVHETDMTFDENILALKRELSDFNAFLKVSERNFKKGTQAALILNELKHHFIELQKLEKQFFEEEVNETEITKPKKKKK